MQQILQCAVLLLLVLAAFAAWAFHTTSEIDDRANQALAANKRRSLNERCCRMIEEDRTACGDSRELPDSFVRQLLQAVFLPT